MCVVYAHATSAATTLLSVKDGDVRFTLTALVLHDFTTGYLEDRVKISKINFKAQSDIEWKFGLSKLIRSMHRTSTAPSPINLITTWLFYLVDICKKRVKSRKRQSLVHLMGSFQRTSQLSPRSKAGAKWLSKVKKGRQIAPKESIALSMSHLSPLGSQLSFTTQTTRIEHVTDWDAIAKKYRALMGHIDEVKEQSSDSNTEEDDELHIPIMMPTQNASASFG